MVIIMQMIRVILILSASDAMQRRDRLTGGEKDGWIAYALAVRSVFKFHVCFCGLDPGNLKFETVRTNKQHMCF